MHEHRHDNHDHARARDSSHEEGGAPAPPGRRTLVETEGRGAIVQLSSREHMEAQVAEERRTDLTFEQLAHRFAYMNAIGDSDRRDLEQLGFDHPQLIRGDHGFAMFTFAPIARAGEPPRLPIVAFRGSDDFADAAADANRAGVGIRQYQANEQKIVSTIERLGGRADLTGHSLGGTLAQLTAASHPGLAHRVITFQAPGIDAEQVDRMRETPEGRAVESRHHVVDGDVAHRSGEAHTPGTAIYHRGQSRPRARALSTSIGAPHRSMPLAEEAIRAGELPAGAQIPEELARRAPSGAPVRGDAGDMDHSLESTRRVVGEVTSVGPLGDVIQRRASGDRSTIDLLAGVAHVQARGSLGGAGVRAAAARGVSGGGAALPHLDLVQRSFGHHDVGGVRAHVGGASAEAAAAMGATAYATGDHVAFAASPDLHLAAHEAAHVVQQRGGVRLAGGVGRAGDEYERHADAVADLVVQGKSAQSLLDEMAHRGAAGGPAVQRYTEARDQRALDLARRLLGGEHGARDATALASALDRALDAANESHVIVEANLGGEDYHFELPIEDARALRGECQAAARRSLGAPAAAIEQPRRTGSAPRTLSSLEPTALGSVIEYLGGGERETTTLNVAVQIAIEVITIGGSLALEVSHGAEGYEVSFTPRMTVGVGAEGTGAQMFTENATMVSGATAEQAAREISMALHHTLASSERAMPVSVATAIAALPGGVFILTGDTIARAGNYLLTGEATSPAWQALANELFGDTAGHAATRSRMGEHDYVETRDTVGAGASVERGDVEASVEGARQRTWRVEGEHGETEHAYTALDVGVTLSLGAFSGEASIRGPASADDRAAFAGETSISVAAEAEDLGPGRTALVALAGWILQKINETAGETAATPSLSAALGNSSTITDGLENRAVPALAARGNVAASAKIVFEATIPFDGAPTATVTLETEAGEITAGSGATLGHGDEIWSWTGRPFRPPAPAAPRPGRGAEHATTGGGRIRPRR